MMTESFFLPVRLMGESGKEVVPMGQGTELYRRYLSGDDSAAEALVELYKDGLMLYINRYTENIFLAEELMEEVFFRLLTRRPRFFGKSSFKTWLFAMARNVALDQLRRDSRSAALPEEEWIRAETADAERHYLKKEQALRLHEAIKHLPPEYSRVLYLIYFEDFSNADAARVLGKTKRQVENLSYRAKQALRRQLETEGFDYERYE